MREGCRRILVPEGHQVITAESGEKALSLFVQGAFDLALIDLKMPGMSGLDLLERLRQLDPGLICIMITAYATLETAVQSTKSGAYDYLAKPFTPDELVSVVDKALDLHWLSQETARLREEAERNLLLVAAEQSRTRTIIQSMADGVLATNREGKLVFYNPALLRLLGVKGRTPAIGEAPSPDQFPAELVAWVQEAFAAGGRTMASHDLPGGPPHLAANIAVIRDEHGETLGVVAVVRDITALKTLNQRMSDFVSMVAHELRSPLGAIAQYLDVILGGITQGQPEKERHILSRCRERTHALSQLVRDLLEFSRLQGEVPGQRTLAPLHLAEVIQEVVAFASQSAQARKVTVTVALPGALPAVEADRDEISRLFANLLDNAIKYNREGGQVRVTSWVTNGYVAAAVSDTGLGIPPAALPRLGEAFFRAKTPATAYIIGTGLGLSICTQIIEAHHGHLEIESEEGKGSTFRVLLPRTTTADGAPGA